ncbi:S41 family peptidase [Diaminobutyricimonas sp. LJ205]|uniref:S41 family peptidase n=1 Tax=Diaminobutyricimonas sp. LJ205 TaxID=2683590 RepID=UPI0012F4A9DC|nr:S41 family peptidase [Diaminobutyricimonas sp. LJ205]
MAILTVVGCTGEPSAEVRDYVTDALDFIEENALYVDDIDWDSVRTNTLDRTAEAQSYEDVHDDIAEAVKLAGGNHSWFASPKAAGDAQSPSQMAPPVAEALEDGIAKMTIPSFNSVETGQIQRYADAGLTGLISVSERASCGWVVDLRGNGGGNMWPMLAALSPFFMPGSVVGGFQDRNGNTTDAIVELGSAALDGEVLAAGAADAPLLDDMPVAVLHDRGTGSSGEIVAAAFRGRPGTLSFGLPTWGYMSANITEKLRDGAEIVLTSAHIIDGRGDVLPSTPMQPDVKIAAGGDAAERAAVDWLRSECSA